VGSTRPPQQDQPSQFFDFFLNRLRAMLLMRAPPRQRWAPKFVLNKIEPTGCGVEPRLSNGFGAGPKDGLHSDAIPWGENQNETRFSASFRSEVKD
jgi:hypothetical protein